MFFTQPFANRNVEEVASALAQGYACVKKDTLDPSVKSNCPARAAGIRVRSAPCALFEVKWTLITNLSVFCHCIFSAQFIWFYSTCTPHYKDMTLHVFWFHEFEKKSIIVLKTTDDRCVFFFLTISVRLQLSHALLLISIALSFGVPFDLQSLPFPPSTIHFYVSFSNGQFFL